MKSGMTSSGRGGAMDGIGWRGLVGRGPLHRVRAMPSTKARAVLQGFKQKTVGAEGGIRTHTGVYAQRFLRPSRLPFRHFGISG